LLAEEQADFVAMSRPLIREPHLIQRWRMGDERRSECKSDNLCFRPATEGKGLYCVVEAKESGKAE
jgi:2,4-dienoyl-CoA reductase-like NADH-dependent reductase (Old Yellow Enzyme family)